MPTNKQAADFLDYLLRVDEGKAEINIEETEYGTEGRALLRHTIEVLRRDTEA